MKSEFVWILLINLLLTAGFAVLIYLGLREQLAYKITKRLLSRGAPNTKARVAKQGQGFNPANVYFTLNYDCRKADLEISGVVPEGQYWSLVPYDRYTVPLESYLMDKTVVTDDEGHYTAYLTTRPQGKPNEINVSTCPRGFVIIRNSLPKNPSMVAQSQPEVKTALHMPAILIMAFTWQDRGVSF